MFSPVPFLRLRNTRNALWLFILGVAGAATVGFLVWRYSPERGQDHMPEPPVDIAALTARAEQGDAVAQAKLGRLYCAGEGVTNDYSQAAKWFAKAAAQGNPDGQLGLGELHEAGRGVARDSSEALRLYRLAAEQGHPSAEYTLGFMYEAGRGVAADPREAAKWFLRAAEHGHALAQYDIGQRYDLGVGVPLEKAEAIKWLMLAAAQGQTDAEARLKLLEGTLPREQVLEGKRRAAIFKKTKAASN